MEVILVLVKNYAMLLYMQLLNRDDIVKCGKAIIIVTQCISVSKVISMQLSLTLGSLPITPRCHLTATKAC